LPFRVRATPPSRWSSSLDPLVVGEGAGYVAPEHLFQDVECSLDLGDVETRLEAKAAGTNTGPAAPPKKGAVCTGPGYADGVIPGRVRSFPASRTHVIV
jgi:hypothetical protein